MKAINTDRPPGQQDVATVAAAAVRDKPPAASKVTSNLSTGCFASCTIYANNLALLGYKLPWGRADDGTYKHNTSYMVRLKCFPDQGHTTL